MCIYIYTFLPLQQPSSPQTHHSPRSNLHEADASLLDPLARHFALTRGSNSPTPHHRPIRSATGIIARIDAHGSIKHPRRRIQKVALLKEKAAIIGGRIRDRLKRQARVVQIEDSPVAVDGHTLRDARFRKGDNLPLMREGDGDVVGAIGVICAGAVVEGVSVVVGVEGGRDAELVAVGLVVEGAVEEVGGAGDGVFGHEEDGAAEVVGVGEAAVEGWRVERCRDVRDRAGVCAWQPELNKAGEGVGGVGGWEGE